MSDKDLDSIFPPITQEPLLHVDATPNEGLALRILRAYRANCDCFYEVGGVTDNSKLLWDMVNEMQRKRAKLLDEAIAKLG